MSFNMMYKFILSLVLVIVLLCQFPQKRCSAEELIDKINQGKDTTEQMKEDYEGKRADLLLIYGTQMTEGEEENLALLLQMLSGMNKSVEYGTYEECGHKINSQDYIICFCVEKSETECIRKLYANRDHKILIIGTDFLKAYMDMTNRSYLISQIEEQTEGSLEYQFGELQKFTTLLPVEHAVSLRRCSYESGRVSIGSREYALGCSSTK